MAEASRPRSLSTRETRTLKVPKSTPATTAILFLRQLTETSSKQSPHLVRFAFRIKLGAIDETESYQQSAPPHGSMQLGKSRSWRTSVVMRPRHQAAGQNDAPVDQEQHSHK